jgi:hypothetical protein
MPAQVVEVLLVQQPNNKKGQNRNDGNDCSVTIQKVGRDTPKYNRDGADSEHETTQQSLCSRPRLFATMSRNSDFPCRGAAMTHVTGYFSFSGPRFNLTASTNFSRLFPSIAVTAPVSGSVNLWWCVSLVSESSTGPSGRHSLLSFWINSSKSYATCAFASVITRTTARLIVSHH